MPILFADNSNMFIDHTRGSIGIGVSSSTSNLHVVGQTLLNGNLTVSGFASISNVSFSSSITLTGLTVTGTGITGILNTSSQPNITSLGTLTGLTVNTGLTVLSNGNVGLGTATPQANLHVIGPVNLISSTSSTGLFVRFGNVGIGTNTPNANLQVIGTTQLLDASGTTGLYVSTLGNVGIGTATPNANLHVMGYTQILGTSGTGGMFIDTVGEVGINTSQPTSNLHVLGTTQILGVSGTTGMYVSSLGNIGIGITNPNANLHVLGHTRLLGQSGLTGLYISNIGNVGIGTAFPTSNLHVLGYSQILNSAGTTGLYVSSVGNVGIGSTNPNYQFHINTTVNYPVVIQSAFTNGTNSYSHPFSAINASLSTNETTMLQVGYAFSNYNLGYIGFVYVGNGSTSNYASIGLYGVDRILNITGSSRVGIGVTNPSSALEVNGSITCNNQLTGSFAINSTAVNPIFNCGSGGTWFSSSIYNSTSSTATYVVCGNSNGYLQRLTSSIKYKKDVETLTDKYSENLWNFRPVWFRSNTEVNIYDNSKYGYYGFIAEEVAEIDPRLATFGKNEDGTLEPEGVAYTSFVPLIVAEMKKLREIVLSSNVIIHNLINENEQLKIKVNSLL